MSNFVQRHRQQPTKLPRPWDSPGKNTGVGCHFLLQCMKVKSESEVAQSCPTLSDPMGCSLPGSSVHGIFQARVLEWVAIAFSIHIHYSVVKNPPIMQETQGTWFWSLDQEDTLEEEMETHSSILAWRIPLTEKPGGLQSTGSQRVERSWETEPSFTYIIEWLPRSR